MFSSNKPNYLKLRTNLRLCINRLKLLEKKKTELALKARREIADYIAAGKEDRARIRVEHIIREDYLVEAMEIIEMLCDLLLARFGLIERMTELDPGLEEAICTLIWVTPRMVADIQELKEVSLQLTIKYGKEYADMCRRNGFENVNEKVLHKMTLSAPPKILVENYMLEIARTYKVPFEPDPVVMMGQPPDTNDLIELGLDSLKPNSSMPIGGLLDGSPAEKIHRSDGKVTPNVTVTGASGMEGFGEQGNTYNTNGLYNGGALPPAENEYYETLIYDDANGRTAGANADKFKQNPGSAGVGFAGAGGSVSPSGLKNSNHCENTYEVLDYSRGQDRPPSWQVADAGDRMAQFGQNAGIGQGANGGSRSAQDGPGFDVGENSSLHRPNTVPTVRPTSDNDTYGGFGVPTYHNPAAGGIPVLPMNNSNTFPSPVQPSVYEPNTYSNEVSPPRYPSPRGTVNGPPPPPGRPPNSGSPSANVSSNHDPSPSLPPYEEYMRGKDRYPPVPTPRNPGTGPSSGNGAAPGLPDIPNLPEIPGLPSVPVNSVGGASVRGDDVDFDDLTRRFEELKRRK